MNTRKLLQVSLWAASGFFLAACRKPSAPVMARVGGTEITLADLRVRIQETPAAYQQYLASADGRKQFFQMLIREKVLLEEARRSGLGKSDSYRKALELFHEKMKQRAKDYEENLLIETYVRQLRSKDLAATDAEVRRYYEEHRADYGKPVEIHASHILLNSEAEAGQALVRLQAKEPFEQVARALSKDRATAVRGGQLSPFRRGTLVPEFEEAVSRLKTGEVSGIVKTSFGFHIIKKVGQTLLPPISFDQAKEEIRARLEREKFDHWVSKKQLAMGVTIDDKALASLETLAANAHPEEPSRP